MSFWTEQRPMTGMQTTNEKKIVCRYCRHATRHHLDSCTCEKYPKWKPDDVMFENAPCSEFEEGEDLLPFQIQI